LGPNFLSKCEKIIIGVAIPTKDFFKVFEKKLKKKRGFGIGFVIFRAPTLASYQNNSKIILKKLMSYLSCSQIFGWLCQCGYTTKMKKKNLGVIIVLFKRFIVLHNYYY